MNDSRTPMEPPFSGIRALVPIAERLGRSDDVVVRCARAFATAFAEDPARPRLTAIAKAIGCSRNSVRAYLIEAHRRGLLALVLRLPKDETLSDRLARRYNLAEAIVTLTPTNWSDQASVRAALAAEAVWYLERACCRFADLRGKDGSLRIGMDGGLTLYKAAHEQGLLVLPPLKYELVPLVFGPLEGSSYTATVVSNVFASKLDALGLSVRVCDPFTIRRDSGIPAVHDGRLHLTLEMNKNAASKLDLLFVGIGSEKSGLFQREMQLLGKRQRPRKHFGDILSLGFDRNGRELNLVSSTQAVLLNLEQLKNLSTSQTALVVGVAGGEAKVDAIRVVLEQRYVSALITDSATAAALVDAK